MEYTNLSISLLSLIWALRDLKEPLNQEEKEELANVGKQLRAKIEYWENPITRNLLAAIEKNSKLSEKFEFYKSKFFEIDGDIPDNLLPTEEDLKSIRSSSDEQRAVALGKPDDRNKKDIIQDKTIQVLFNTAIEVMTNDIPTEAAKKIKFSQNNSYSSDK